MPINTWSEHIFHEIQCAQLRFSKMNVVWSDIDRYVLDLIFFFLLSLKWTEVRSKVSEQHGSGAVPLGTWEEPTPFYLKLDFLYEQENQWNESLGGSLEPSDGEGRQFVTITITLATTHSLISDLVPY